MKISVRIECPDRFCLFNEIKISAIESLVFQQSDLSNVYFIQVQLANQICSVSEFPFHDWKREKIYPLPTLQLSS